MRKPAAQRMRDILSATGCYQLTGDSPADWELNAAGALLDAAEKEMESLLDDLSPAAAGQGRLGQLEALWRPDPLSGETEDVRRKMAASRAHCNPGVNTLSDYEGLLPAVGVTGSIQEDGAALSVLAGKVEVLDREEIASQLDELLPAHLPWTWVEELNWAMLDARAKPWQEMDAKKMQFFDWEALTPEQVAQWDQEPEEEQEELEEYQG